MITIPVTFDSANRRKDKAVSLRFSSTFEVSTQDFSKMDELIGQTGWVVFKPNETVDLKDVPKEQAPSEGKKPSVRLRAVIFRYWEQNTDQSEPFDTHYYPKAMERLIEQYKGKLT